MQIDLPDSVIAEADRLAAAGVGRDAADVIIRAVGKLTADRDAIQEGISAYAAGDYRSLESFGAEIRERFGVQTPEG